MACSKILDANSIVVTIQLTVFGRGYSPPPRGGEDATSRKYREASFEERTGWSLTSHVSECVLNTACDRPRFLMAAPCRLMFRAIALTLRAGLRGLRPPSAPLRKLRDIKKTSPSPL